MISSSYLLLYGASKFMPAERQDWLSAMIAEMDEIKYSKEKQNFAYGCFRTAISEWSRSRRGLHYIARGAGACGLLMLGLVGLYVASTMGEGLKEVRFSQVVSKLCLFYILSAFLLMASIKATKVVASGALMVAIASACYFKVTNFNQDYLSTELITALNFEFTAIVTILFMATIYLDWLYSPRDHIV